MNLNTYVCWPFEYPFFKCLSISSAWFYIGFLSFTYWFPRVLYIFSDTSFASICITNNLILWAAYSHSYWREMIFFFLMFMYYFERERERERESARKWGRGRERGRKRIPSRFCAVSTETDLGLEPTNHEIMTWAKVGCLIDWAIQVPRKCFVNK